MIGVAVGTVGRDGEVRFGSVRLGVGGWFLVRSFVLVRVVLWARPTVAMMEKKKNPKIDVINTTWGNRSLGGAIIMMTTGAWW